MRWEVLVMMALLGAVNLIGRWLSARQKAKMRDQQAAEDLREPRTRSDETPRVRVERPGVPPSRPSQPTPTAAARPKVKKPQAAAPVVRPARAAAVEPLAAAKAGDVRLPGLAGKVALQAAIARQASRRPRWTAKALRNAFVASEIFAKPSSLRV